MARLPKKQPILATKRLRLRAFRASDIEAMHTLYADAENLRYWSTPPSADLGATRRAMRWHIIYRPSYYVIWAVEESKSRKVIGMINYHHRNLREKRVDVGWLILPQHQGKGYMTEAGRALIDAILNDDWAGISGFSLGPSAPLLMAKLCAIGAEFLTTNSCPSRNASTRGSNVQQG